MAAPIKPAARLASFNQRGPSTLSGLNKRFQNPALQNGTRSSSNAATAIPSLGIAAWWDANDLTGVVTDGGSVGTSSSNGWVDRVAGVVLSEATGVNPLMRANSLNGQPGIDFVRGGAFDSRLAAFTNRSFFDNVNGATVFVVAKQRTSSATQTLVFASTAVSSGNTRLQVGTTAAGVTTLSARRLDADTVSTVTGSAGLGTAATIIRTTMDWSSGAAAIVTGKTTSVLSGTPTSSGYTDNTLNQVFAVGNGSNAAANTTGFDGLIYEVIIYDRVLPTEDIAQVENYLTNKWLPTEGTAPLSVSPAVDAAGVRVQEITAPLTISPSTSADGTVTLGPKTAQADLTTTPSTDVAASTTQSASASLTVTPAVTAAGAEVLLASAPLTTTPSTAAAGAETLLADTSLTTTPSTAAAGARTQSAAGDLTSSPTSTAAAATTQPASASLTVSPSTAADGTVSTGAVAKTAQADLAVAPSTTAAATVVQSASATVVTVTPSTSAAGTRAQAAAADLTVTPTSGTGSQGTKPGDVSVIVAATTTAAGSQIRVISGSLVVAVATAAGAEIVNTRGSMRPATKATATAGAAQRAAAAITPATPARSTVAVLDRPESSMSRATRSTSTMTGA